MAAIGAIGEGLFELGLDEGDVEAPVRRGYGGDAANTAVMAALLGADARLCSRVGEDALGTELVDFWRRSNVDTTWVRVDGSGPTGVYVNERLSAGGARFHYHRSGSAGSRLEPGDVDDAFLAGLDVLHYTGVTLAISESAAETAGDAVQRARRQGIRVSFAVNHRPALAPDGDALRDAARSADFVFLSAEDAHALLGTDDAEEALATFDAPEAVLTLGPEGAAVRAAGNDLRVVAPPAEIVDASGAGDALAGAYLASRLAGFDPEPALERAVEAATLSCAGFGCALSYPDAAAVDAALAARP